MSALLWVHRVWSGGDSLDYLAMIRSLQQGDWGSAFQWRYPLGYPALAAGWLSLAGQTIPANFNQLQPITLISLQLMGVCAFVLASPVVVAWLGRLGLPHPLVLAVAFLMAVHQTMAALSSVIGTDIVFLPLIWLALARWERAAGEPGLQSRAWVASLLTVLAILVREAGVVTSLAVLVWIVMTWRSRRASALILPALLPVAVLALYTCLRGSSVNVAVISGGDPFQSGATVPMVQKILTNIPAYTAVQFDLIFPKVGGVYGLLSRLGWSGLEICLGWLLLMVLAVACLLHMYRTGLRISHVFGGGVVGVTLLWPHVNLRYLFPLYPLLMALLLWAPVGVFRSSRAAKHALRFSILGASFLLVWSLATNVFAGSKNIRTMIDFKGLALWDPARYRHAREDEFADFIEAAIRLQEDVPAHAVVYGFKTSFLELASGRRAMTYRAFTDGEDLWASVREQARNEPCYILRDALPTHSRFRNARAEVLEPALAAHADQLRVVWTNARGYALFEVKVSP